MAKQRRRRPRERRSVAWLVVGSVLLLIAAAAGAWAVHALTVSDTTVEVTVRSGEVEEIVSVRSSGTLADAVARAGVAPHDGNTVSAKDGRVLGLRDFPATFLLDDEPAAREFPLYEGAVIEVIDGEDRVEETEVRDEVIPAPRIDGEIRRVHRLGAEGMARVTVGVRSGELIEREVIEEPVAPEPVDDKVVALTFDDGPDGRYTPTILAILADHGVEATFCMVGSVVDRNADLVQQVVDGGHALCNHTYSHDAGMVGKARAEVDKEVGDGLRSLTSNGFAAPPYYRAPGGHLDDQIREVVATYDEVILDWTVDTRDWEAGATVETIMEKVEAEMRPGAIILLHDGGGERPHSMLATALIIETLHAQGYEFVLPTIER